jgi:hypothetical protein
MIRQIILSSRNSRACYFWAAHNIAYIDHMSLSLVWLSLIEAARRRTLLHPWHLGRSCNWSSSKLILRELFKHLPLLLNILFVLV